MNEFTQRIIEEVNKIAISGSIYLPANFMMNAYRRNCQEIAKEHKFPISNELLTEYQKNLYNFNQKSDVLRMFMEHKKLGVSIKDNCLLP